MRPPDDVFYTELQTRYRRVRLFLPTLLHQVHFEAAPAGAAVVAALEYLKRREAPARAQDVAPSAVVTTAWRRYVYGANDAVDHRAYTFCVLDQLREALRRRDVFVTPSWRYADPRRNLLAGAEWEAARPIMCRTLGYSPRPEPILAALSDELDQTYRAVAARLPNNPAVRFERIDGKDELIVSPLDKVEEPAALVALRTAIAGRLPRVACASPASVGGTRSGVATDVTDAKRGLVAVRLGRGRPWAAGIEPRLTDHPLGKPVTLSWASTPGDHVP